MNNLNECNLVEAPTREKQEFLWDEYITGSQVYELLKVNTRQNLLLEKQGIIKKNNKGLIWNKKLIEHGTLCEEILGIPFCEDKFGCKNDLKKSFIYKQLSISGNTDFYNREENILCEIKTTSYLDDVPFEKQSITIIKGVYQLLFYQQAIYLATKKLPRAYLVIIRNNHRCVSTNIKNHPSHEIICLSLEDLESYVPGLSNVNMMNICYYFWEDFANFTENCCKDELENNKIIENIKSDFENEIKMLKKERVAIENKMERRILIELDTNKKRVNQLTKELIEYKKKIVKPNSFFYSKKHRTSLYRYSLKTEREYIGIKEY